MYLRRLKNIFTRPKPIRYFVSLFLWKTGLCRFLLIKRPGFRLRFYPSALHAALWWNPDSRSDQERLIQALVRDAALVVDVGANVGHLSLSALCSMKDGGKILAFEPHPRIYSYLQGNLALNGVTSKVETRQCALGSGIGEIRFSDKGCDDQNHVVLGSDQARRVRMSTLDTELVAVPGQIDLLKIDVEGYEFETLRGATNTLKRTSTVLFEITPDNRSHFGFTCRQLIELFISQGFTILRLDDEGKLTNISADFHPEQVEDLIATRTVGDLTQRLAA